MGARSAVPILFRHELAKGESVEELEATYQQTFAGPLPAAIRGYIDDIIEPSSTRARLCADLNLLMNKRQPMCTRYPRKHANMPLWDANKARHQIQYECLQQCLRGLEWRMYWGVNAYPSRLNRGRLVCLLCQLNQYWDVLQELMKAKESPLFEGPCGADRGMKKFEVEEAVSTSWRGVPC